MRDDEILNQIESLEEFSAWTPTMLELMRDIFNKGFSLDWFLDNWVRLVYDEGVSTYEVSIVGPWVETWAREAWDKMQKEAN